MKEVSVISRTTPARQRSKNYVQGTAIYGGGGSKDILIPTNYIRDDQDDGTNYLLYVGTFLDSMKEGTGIGLFPEGRAQADKFEARKQIQIGEAMLFWDDANKAIGIKRVAVPASEDGTGEIKESEIGVYSQGWMSAKGIDKGEEEGTGGATTIGQLVNVGEWADQTASYDRILVQLSGSNMWTEKKLSEIGGGLDEEQLATYLTENNYAKKTDIPSLEGYATETWVTNKGYITSAALTGYATQDWVLSKSYATTSDLDARIDALVNGAPAAFDTLKEIADVLQGNVDSIGDILTTLGTKADKTIAINAGTGLTGGGNLSANRTISLKPATTTALGGIIVGERLSIDASGVLSATYTYTHPSATATTISAATGKVLSAITVNNLGHVTSVTAKTLAAADIPTLQISKISGLQNELDSKLDQSIFNDLFEKVEISTGVYAIRAKYGLYSNEFISAKGVSEGEGGGGSGSSYLSDLLDVSLTSLAVNDLLKWNGKKWVNVPQSSIVPSLAWNNITGKPSWIGSTKPSYAWSEITGKPSTFPPSSHVHDQYYDSEISRTANTVLAAPNGVNGKATFRKLVSADLPIHSHDWGNITGTPTSVSGYGIVDAYRIKSGSPDNEKGMCAGYYANVGSYASFVQSNYGGQLAFYAGGTLKFRGINNNYAHDWKTVLDTSNYASTLDSRYLLKTTYTASDILSKLKTVDGSGSGLDADTLDGTEKSGLLTTLSSSSATNLSLTVGGTTKTITNLYAEYWEGSTTYNPIITIGSWSRILTIRGYSSILLSIQFDGTNQANQYVCYIGTGFTYANMYQLGGNGYTTNGEQIRLTRSDSTTFHIEIKSDYIYSGASTQSIKCRVTKLSPSASYNTYTSATAGGGTAVTTFSLNSKTLMNAVVESATKLQSARTIWGKSFDGTGNVDGLISITQNGNTVQIGSQNTYFCHLYNSANMAFIFNNSILTINGDLGSSQYKFTNLYLKGTANIVNIQSTGLIRTSNKFSAGEYQEDSYGYYNCTRPSTPGTFCCYAMVRQGSWAFGIGYDSSNRIIFGTSTTSKTISAWFSISQTLATMNGGITATGNITANGAITAKAVSDIRLKTIIQEKIDYRKKLLGLGSVVDFRYNELALKRGTGAVDKERHIGLIYQLAKTSKLVNFCHEDEDGFGSINYLSTDYINLIAGALQQTIRKQETIEQRVVRLEQENKELKQQLNKLSA